MSTDYDGYFQRLAHLPGGMAPHDWQRDLAGQQHLGNRLIRIPTGFGKTFGVLGAWLWNRVEQRRQDWPRRLVWCLPMRVLVEQVVAEIGAALHRCGRSELPVNAVMGGVDAGDWHLAPEREAVLVGTQDMLLSRAMNRGYGAGRARWPMDFGLLNQDCLWIMDEVQLMDVGLATSAQLQAFREQDAATRVSYRPCRTWWMSATLQRNWIGSSPEAALHLGQLPTTQIEASRRRGPLWDDVNKPVRVLQHTKPKEIASVVAEAHQRTGRGERGLTLVVVNRVDDAVEIYGALRPFLAAGKALHGTDLRLIHSRFRPAERAAWRESFLNRGACAPGNNRIVVATQVVEAGVDMSAAVLVSAIAPWPSLVQRFGRCARWGGTAEVIVIDSQPKDAKAAAPYDKAQIDAAREALSLLDDVSPRSLEAFEERHPERLPALYPYDPAHLLMRNEIVELFDTAADLSGADIDISRFIRSGEERDLQVFWRDVEPKVRAPSASIRPARDELCAVPFLRAREWLCGKGARLLPGLRAWRWDWVEAEWVVAERRTMFPGQTLLVASDVGGYDREQGWDGRSRVPVAAVPNEPTAVGAADVADSAEDDESLSAAFAWQTIGFHGAQVGRHAAALADALAPALRDLLDLAGRWHDAGKAHPAFQGCLTSHRQGQEVAKAPKDAWLRPRQLYRMPDGTQRRGFRHELASTLALFALLRRCQPDHPALLGPWRELLSRLPGAAHDLPPSRDGDASTPSAIEQEVLATDAAQFDLLAYLVCSHHGKVRMSWHASPADQAANDATLRIRGVRAGDVLPAFELLDASGARHRLPPTELVLAAAGVGLNPHTGRGWTERVLRLLERFGPFTLAWLEALLRAADQRATREAGLADPALVQDNGDHGLAGSDSPLAGLARVGEAQAALGEHSAQRGAQLRVRGRAGGPEGAGGGTRPPAHATRYLETRLGALSYLELAPHLARAASQVEQAIENGEFDATPLDEQLVADLHRRLCAELTPQLSGWRKTEVRVGQHEPPAPHRVLLLMREYALDLQARLQGEPGGEHLLEALAFAEGRLLSIHPFADFNGRVTRLFLRLLLRRLDLPVVDLLPDDNEREAYFAALRAGDQRNWQPLADVWRSRFAGRP